jgi:hypothetical protein
MAQVGDEGEQQKAEKQHLMFVENSSGKQAPYEDQDEKTDGQSLRQGAC